MRKAKQRRCANMFLYSLLRLSSQCFWPFSYNNFAVVSWPCFLSSALLRHNPQHTALFILLPQEVLMTYILTHILTVPSDSRPNQTEFQSCSSCSLFFLTQTGCSSAPRRDRGRRSHGALLLCMHHFITLSCCGCSVVDYFKQKADSLEIAVKSAADLFGVAKSESKGHYTYSSAVKGKTKAVCWRFGI